MASLTVRHLTTSSVEIDDQANDCRFRHRLQLSRRYSCIAPAFVLRVGACGRDHLIKFLTLLSTCTLHSLLHTHVSFFRVLSCCAASHSFFRHLLYATLTYDSMGLFVAQDGRYRGWLAALLCCFAAVGDDEHPSEKDRSRRTIPTEIQLLSWTNADEYSDHARGERSTTDRSLDCPTRATDYVNAYGFQTRRKATPGAIHSWHPRDDRTTAITTTSRVRRQPLPEPTA